jgi:uncharacterized integral membrane protein
VQVPDKFVPHFKAGKELRERVDAQYAEQQAAGGALEAQPTPRSRTGNTTRGASFDAGPRSTEPPSMPLLTWTVRLILFIVLLAFAVKNTDLVTLRFYFDLAWEGPLVIVLFGVLAIGAVLGLAATTGTLLRQRREIARLRREQRQGVSLTTRESPAAPPAIDA